MHFRKFLHNSEFVLENGESITNLEIGYHTIGKLNEKKDNVIWVCHALTANSDVSEWWPGMLGKYLLFDPAKYFIVCANIIGSCYGTTGPLSFNPKTGNRYFKDFPSFTIRDMVKAHELLRQNLQINRIHLLIGGSIGGYQALEWSIINPGIIDHMVLIATNAKTSPWAIAFNESQRMALVADHTFKSGEGAGANGLKAARSIALLSYRNSITYNTTQYENDDSLTDNFKACSYQQYQGEKLIKRFNAFSYFTILKAMDTHNVARKRGSIKGALKRIKAKTLLVAIPSDILFPPEEIRAMTNYIHGSYYAEIESFYGHDGFLIETKQLTEVIRLFLNEYGKEREN